MDVDGSNLLKVDWLGIAKIPRKKISSYHPGEDVGVSGVLATEDVTSILARKMLPWNVSL